MKAYKTTKREIKFRAIKDDISNCNWVYGQLVYDAIGCPRITEVDSSGQGLTFHTCIRETEGQYTGLKDENGKEIYESDIVLSSTGREEYQVVWNGSGWFNRSIKNPQSRLHSLIQHHKLQKVVGNIFERSTSNSI